MADVIHGRGYVYSIKYHIVWCTKLFCSYYIRTHRRANKRIYKKSKNKIKR